MNNSQLKIVAIITMLIDHIGAILYPDLIVLRMIGRISFPIFAFLIVEGYIHTKDFKKYLLRIFIVALITEIPYDFAFEGKLFDINAQNVLFTFTLSLLLLHIMNSDKKSVIKSLSITGILIVSYVFRVDYSFYGILMVIAFYTNRENDKIKYILLISINMLIVSQNIYYFGFSMMNITQMFAVLSIPFIMRYNGKKGVNLKYVFYMFYPVHLLILGFINYGYMI